MDDVSKTTDETTVPVGALIPQEHGGALRYGGTNKGGTGRPPNALRGSMREILEKGLPHLEEFVTGEKEDAKPSDQLKAMEIAGRFGLKEVFDKGLIDELLDATEAAVGDDPALIQRIRKAWSPIIVLKLMANG